jgi:hypothetical protein
MTRPYYHTFLFLTFTRELFNTGQLKFNTKVVGGLIMIAERDCMKEKVDGLPSPREIVLDVPEDC